MGKKTAPPPDDQFKPMKLDVEDIGTLVLAMQSKEMKVAGNAMDSIDAFADKSEKNREELVALGALPTFLELLVNENTEIADRAGMCLSTVTESYNVRLQCKGDFNSQLLPLLQQKLSNGTPVAQENAASVVANLCTEFSVRRLAVEHGIVPPLVTLLSSTNPATIKHVLTALVHLASDYAARGVIVGCDAITPLMATLAADYREVQEKGLVLISKLALNETIRRQLNEAGVVEKVVDFITKEDFASSHVVALRALSSLLYDPVVLRAVAAIPDGGTMESTHLHKVLTFLTSQDQAAKVEALKCLAAAAFSKENRAVLRDFKAETHIVAQLVPEDPKQPIHPDVSTSACQALSAMAVTQASASVIVSLGGLSKIAKLLAHEAKSCVQASVELLAVVAAAAPSAAQKIHDATFAKINEFMQSTARKMLPVQEHAAAVIVGLARDPAIKKAMVSPLKGLVAGLQRGAHTENLKRNCLNALTLLCELQSYRTEFSTLDAFSLVVEHVGASSKEITLSACRCITQVCVDPSCAIAFYDNDVVPSLLNVASNLNHSSTAVSGALHAVLNSHLSAKYSLEHVLTEENKLNDIFFDCGRMSGNGKFSKLCDLLEADVNASRPIFLVNMSGKKKDDVLHIPTLPTDDSLKQFCSDVQTLADNCDTIEEKMAVLAKSVSARLGGVVSKLAMRSFSCSLHHVELKQKNGSNLIPIGQLEKGGAGVRSLLLKTVCDFCSIPCALVLGEYDRAFCVIKKENEKGFFAVDVMHSPGTLQQIPSYNTIEYLNPFA